MDYKAKWEAEWDAWADEVAHQNQVLPRARALALLRNLQFLQRTGEIGSAMDKHAKETGHRLAFGCCKRLR